MCGVVAHLLWRVDVPFHIGAYATSKRVLVWVQLLWAEMMIASPQLPLTPEAYLQLESASAVKHEFVDGDVYAMAGASDTHVTTQLRLFVPDTDFGNEGGFPVTTFPLNWTHDD